jgi:ketosteroid isomerase-like protein
VLVDYRWINSERNQAETGRATFVCEQKPKGWRIVHVHSSQILPWDR